MRLSCALTILFPALAPIARAQDATIVYRLGRDTAAIEQYSKTATSMKGEMVARNGAAVTRVAYDFTLGVNGQPTAAVVRRRQADGTPLPNTAAEYRFAIRPDGISRDTKVISATSDSIASFRSSMARAFVALPVFAYAPFELLYARGPGARDSVPAMGITGNGTSTIGLVPYAGDTLRMRGGSYQMLVHFDRAGNIDRVDGTSTTNKVIGMRTPGRVDIAAIARTMKPAGVLSPRATAYAQFAQGPIFINYGRPAVRERTVWGGVLVPFDSIWRVGANEAAHLATSKTMLLGDMTLVPGLYTLWIQHTRDATWLIVNKQVGQWGTSYQPSQDIGRVKMDMTPLAEHVEDFTITIRGMGARGSMDFAWEKTQATANFTIR